MRDYIKANDSPVGPASIETLKDNIEGLIREIAVEMLEKVCQNWSKQMDHLRRSRVQNLHDIFI